MSRNLDYDNLSEDDKDWLRARGWGHRIPGEAGSDPHEDAVVLKADASPEEQLSQVPNTGTATWPRDHGVEINPVNPEGYTEDDYHTWKVADLKAEINDRNEGREDTDLIKPEASRKDDLVAALVADDESHAPGADDGDGSGE